MNERLKDTHPSLLILVLFVIGFIAFMFISGVVAIIINYFQPTLEIENLHLLADKYPVSYMLYFFLPFQLGFLFIPGGYYYFFLKESDKKATYKWKDLVWASLLFIGIFFLLPFFNEINYSIVKWLGYYEYLIDVNRINEYRITQLVGPDSSTEAYLTGILIIAIITAVSEELIFRGFLLNLVLKHTKNAALSIIASAILFALLHFNYLQLIPLIAFGLVLGMMYHVTGTLLPSILFHAANNGINLYWVRNDQTVSWMNEIYWEITIPSILVLMGLIYLKRNKLR